MTVETPADACAALAVLMVGADEIGTIEESEFLFDTMAALPIFAELDRTQFANLVAETTEWVWTAFPTDGNRVTDEGVSDLLELICSALPPDLRMQAFRAAVGLAKSDGVAREELSLLEQLCDGLEIDRALVTEFLGPEA